MKRTYLKTNVTKLELFPMFEYSINFHLCKNKRSKKATLNLFMNSSKIN